MALSTGGGGAPTPSPTQAPGGAAANAMAALEAAAAGGQGAAVSPYSIPIMMGPDTRGQQEYVGEGRTASLPATPVNRFQLTKDGVNSAYGTWFQFDDSERAKLAQKMWFLGLIKDPNDFNSAYSTWQSAVDNAGRFAMVGREIDPRDVLSMMGDASGSASRIHNQGPTTKTKIDLTDPVTARAWITSAFQQSMGRDPHAAEVRSLMDALSQQEKAHPTVVTSTPTKWDAQGNPVAATDVQSNGVDAQAFLQNQVNSDPEAAAHQAAGQLYPALLQMLGGGLS